MATYSRGDTSLETLQDGENQAVVEKWELAPVRVTDCPGTVSSREEEA